MPSAGPGRADFLEGGRGLGFWQEYEASRHAATLTEGGQGDTAGVCAFCGLAGDDVLIGVCGDCAEEECCAA